jgi:peptide/nickel transport system substrate-binding protein
MIANAFRIVHEEVGLIPLHQQTLNWGVAKKVKIVQRADARVLFYWTRMN